MRIDRSQKRANVQSIHERSHEVKVKSPARGNALQTGNIIGATDIRLFVLFFFIMLYYLVGTLSI